MNNFDLKVSRKKEKDFGKYLNFTIEKSYPERKLQIRQVWTIFNLTQRL